VRLVFLGTPADAVPTLRALVDTGHDVALVVTQPDRRRGRGTQLVPSPVKAAALDLGLRVRTPTTAGEVRDEVAATGAEVGVVVAFGQLLPETLFASLPLGFVNVHFSLLPRWRGAAPVERAMLAGDPETGVCIMEIAAGLDTGRVYATASTVIAPDETAGELGARLVDLGTDLLLDTLPDLAQIVPVEQRGEPTYAAKLSVEEFELDWSAPARDLHRLVMAGNPRPGAWTTVDGRRLKVWRTRIDDDGALVLLEVQPDGKPRMDFGDWVRGRHGAPLELGS
jgi:methionyl-tRNA formyltransferase